MPCAGLGFQEHFGGGGERLVDEDPTALRTNTEDFASDVRLIFDLCEVCDDVRRAIDRNYTKFIHRRQHIQNLHRGEVCEVHFRSAAAHCH